MQSTPSYSSFLEYTLILYSNINLTLLSGYVAQISRPKPFKNSSSINGRIQVLRYYTTAGKIKMALNFFSGSR